MQRLTAKADQCVKTRLKGSDLRCRMGGRVADSRERVANARPTRPAAASACPADDLCAASAKVRSPTPGVVAPTNETPGLAASSTAAAAPISMGSPRGVPVPCRCNACTCPHSQNTEMIVAQNSNPLSYT